MHLTLIFWPFYYYSRVHSRDTRCWICNITHKVSSFVRSIASNYRYLVHVGDIYLCESKQVEIISIIMYHSGMSIIINIPNNVHIKYLPLNVFCLWFINRYLCDTPFLLRNQNLIIKFDSINFKTELKYSKIDCDVVRIVKKLVAISKINW